MSADPDLIALFARGWAISRDVPAPVAVPGGHYIEVGQPDQKARYVFAALDAEALARLAARITDPFVYLKVCAEREAVRAVLPSRWIIRQPPTYMMTAELEPVTPSSQDGFTMLVEKLGSMRKAAVLHQGREVARGRMIVLGETALFDQVSTDEAYRRKGLGRLVMHALTGAALEQGASKGLLSATEMGRWLYQTIGWTVHAPYVSAVIPG